MTNPKEGNRIILLALALALAVASLFVTWGVITLTADDLRDSMTLRGQGVSGESMGGLLGSMMSSMLSGMTVPVSGSNGNLVLGPLKIPYWLPIVAVVAGILLTITNSTKLSDVPRKWVVALLVSGIVAGVWAGVVIVAKGTMGVGALLLIASAVIGLSQQKSGST